MRIQSSLQYSPILPVCHKSIHCQDPPGVPSELSTPYKSFHQPEEFFSVRSGFSPIHSNRRKIFEDLNYPSIKHDLAAQPKTYNPKLFLQCALLPDPPKFKGHCLQSDLRQSITIMHDHGLKCSFQSVSLEFKTLCCSLTLQNTNIVNLENIDILLSSDSTIEVFQSDELIKCLRPNESRSISLKVVVLQLPFTFINVSLAIGNKAYLKLLLPITIFNFGTIKLLKNGFQQQENKQSKFRNAIGNYAKARAQFLVGKTFQFTLLQSEGSLSISDCQNWLDIVCSAESSELAEMVLNTLSFLLQN